MARTAAAIALAGLRMAPESVPLPSMPPVEDSGRSTRKRRAQCDGFATARRGGDDAEAAGAASDALVAGLYRLSGATVSKRACRASSRAALDLLKDERDEEPQPPRAAGVATAPVPRARARAAAGLAGPSSTTLAPYGRARASAGKAAPRTAAANDRSGRPRSGAPRGSARPSRHALSAPPSRPTRAASTRIARASAPEAAFPPQHGGAQHGGAERERRVRPAARGTAPPRTGGALESVGSGAGVCDGDGGGDDGGDGGDGGGDGGSGESGGDGCSGGAAASTGGLSGHSGAGVGLFKSSRFVGVHLSHKQLLIRPWLACCWAGGKNHHLGYFKTEEEAATAYDSFARSYHKPLNFADERMGESAATKAVKASRYRGVHFKKGNKTKPWKAVCVVGGRQHHLGYHASEEAAAAAYDAFAAQHGRVLNGVHAPPPTHASAAREG